MPEALTGEDRVLLLVGWLGADAVGLLLESVEFWTHPLMEQQPLGQWSDVTGRLQMPKDLLFHNRITVGASFILGHLYATADWKSIDCEIRHDGPPATEFGQLDAAWRARQGCTVAPPRRELAVSSLRGARGGMK
jgi:hypothetical protein